MRIILKKKKKFGTIFHLFNFMNLNITAFCKKEKKILSRGLQAIFYTENDLM